MRRFCVAWLYRCLLLAAIAFIGLFVMSLELPDVSELKYNTYRAPLQVFSKDEVLLAEYGEMKRLPVTIDRVPKRLIDALVATEDQRFYQHYGLDFWGALRAFKAMLSSGQRKQGASTLTMQVARNFYLTREKTFFRKINEVLLALMIERHASKEEILELYINKVFLGARSYGFRAAAKTYFAKEMHALNVSEIALLVGLPKAPSYYNPIEFPERAKMRRDVVLKKMYERNVITIAEYTQALLEPIKVAYSSLHVMQRGSEYVAELARLAAIKKWGKSVYNSGYRIYTTVDYVAQKRAQEKLSEGLEKEIIEQDIESKSNYLDQYGAYSSAWDKALHKVPLSSTGLHPAVVIDAMESEVLWLYLPGEGRCVRVAKPQCTSKGQRNCVYNTYSVRAGDQVYVRKEGEKWSLGFVPSVQGALVALDPHSGEVKALVGGYQFHRSHFNRAVQAQRQSGSAIKPFLYTLALDKGFTLASMLDDMPLVVNREGAEDWKPKNVDHDFKGMMRLREALVWSRNLVSIRLVKALGVHNTEVFLKKLGITTNSSQDGLSMALGAQVVTPLQLARAYTLFPNHGRLSPVHWVDRVVDGEGQSVLDSAECDAFEASVLPAFTQGTLDVVPETVSYMVSDVLGEVMQRGTGRSAKGLLKRDDVYGKTGTTNQNEDAWFAGYAKDQVVVVWVGHDDHRPLHGGGARLALPIWAKYMHDQLPEDLQYIEKPSGLVSARVSEKTGRRVYGKNEKSLFELFLPDMLKRFEMGSIESDQELLDVDKDDTHEQTSVMEQLF